MTESDGDPKSQPSSAWRTLSVEQARIAAPRGAGPDRSEQAARRPQLRLVDEQVEPPRRDVEPDHVAVLHQRERTADRGLGGDMQDDRAEGGAAHAGVGDPDHVVDARRGELCGIGR